MAYNETPPYLKGTEMNTPTTVVLITLSSLSLIASGATLAIALVGSKKMKAEIDEVKMKSNKAINTLKSALDNLEL